MSAVEPVATIVMSTFNGERFLDNQIQSITDQTHTRWHLIVRDDGSTDRSMEIVSSWAARDNRIEILDDTRGNLGAAGSFGVLLGLAAARRAAYVLLSDQDDVWNARKIEMQLARILGIESVRGRAHPILVHSDLQVVAENLFPVSASFRDFQNMRHDLDDPLSTLLIHNAVVGCATALNEPLLELAVPLPYGCAHDWWIATCAAAAGSVVSMPEVTVRYRQHGQNAIGAPHRHAELAQAIATPLRFLRNALRAFGRGVDQNRALQERLIERGMGLGGAHARVAAYCAAFDRRTSVISRLVNVKASGAMPRRPLSRVLLVALVIVFPSLRRTSLS